MTLRHRSHWVLLDACVLVPISMTDLLLRLAEQPGLFQPKWTREILDEVRGVLIRPPFRLLAEKADYRIGAMVSAFPSAFVQGHEALIETMTNNPGDRHVLAAAVAAGCDFLVTYNTRHFPRESLGPHGVVCLTPDQFLGELLVLDRDRVVRLLLEQAEGSHRSVTEVLNLLSSLAPKFAASVRTLVALDS